MSITRNIIRFTSRNEQFLKSFSTSLRLNKGSRVDFSILSSHQNVDYQLLNKKNVNYSLSLKQFESTKSPGNMSLKEKFRQAIKEYGSTVIVFHIGLSLSTLAIFYILVSSGMDVQKLMTPLGISGETAAKVAANAGTFAVAYAVNKVFAPIRIVITLSATPFIVRYLRKIGFLKIKK